LNTLLAICNSLEWNDNLRQTSRNKTK
jgi:hypothetical protein